MSDTQGPDLLVTETTRDALRAELTWWRHQTTDSQSLIDTYTTVNQADYAVITTTND